MLMSDLCQCQILHLQNGEIEQLLFYGATIFGNLLHSSK